MDHQIVLLLHSWAEAYPPLAGIIVQMAERGIFLLPILLGVFYLWPGQGTPERRQVLLACAASFVLAAVLVEILGHVVDRPRPFVALSISPLFSHPADSSFPSDHTLIGVALVGPLFWRRPRLGVWLVLWALAVGLARVAAGVHYPSDIAGSGIIAILPSAAGLLLSQPLLGRFRFLHWLVRGRPS